jgi:hypothetical protein
MISYPFCDGKQPDGFSRLSTGTHARSLRVAKHLHAIAERIDGCRNVSRKPVNEVDGDLYQKGIGELRVPPISTVMPGHYIC